MTLGDIFYIPWVNHDGSTGDRPLLTLFESPTGAGQDEVVIGAEITASPTRLMDLRVGDISLEDDFALYGLEKPSVIRCRRLFGLNRTNATDTGGNVSLAILAEAQGLAREIVNGG